jgi:hypothetical protein
MDCVLQALDLLDRQHMLDHCPMPAFYRLLFMTADRHG